MTKAIRAIYPVSSRRDRKKNSVTTIGRKLSTEPTPVKTPSMMSECSAWLTLAAVSIWSTSCVRRSTSDASASCRKAPMTLKVR